MVGQQTRGLQWLLLGLLATSSGCFQDIATAVDRVCPDGRATCSCRSDGGCDVGLSCEDGSICRSLRCQDGTPGCACLPGDACSGEATCIDGSCFAAADSSAVVSGSDADGDDSADAGIGTSPPTSGGATSGDGGVDDGGVDDGGDDGGVDDGGVDTGSMSDGGVGEGGDDGPPPPPPSCGCGWEQAVGYWECTADPSDASVNEHQWGCPPGTQDAYQAYLEGDVPPSCSVTDADNVSHEIDVIGCCLGWGVTVFCTDASVGIQFVECSDDSSVYCAGPEPAPV